MTRQHSQPGLLESLYPALVSGWLFFSLAFLDFKVSLPVLGGSEGSTTSGANPFLAEAGGICLFFLVLFLPALRRRLPRRLAVFGAVWGLLFAFGLAWGLKGGADLRNALSDLRYALFPVYLAVVWALPGPGRVAAGRAALAGFALFACVELALLAAVPTGMVNLNIVPVPVPFFNHALHQAWLYPLVGMLALVAGRSRYRWAASALVGALVALSFSRSIWLGVPLAALAAAAWWWRQPSLAMRLGGSLAWMVVAGLLISWSLNTRDGRFLMQFRGHSLCHSLKLCEPLPLAFDPGTSVSPQMRGFARTGQLFTPLGNEEDASVVDRKAMANLALDAFRDSPWFGQGLGYLFRYQSPGGPKVLNNPHNGYLWVLAKLGLLGAAVFLAGLGLSLRYLFSLEPSPRHGWVMFALALALALEVMQCGLGQHAVTLPLAAALVIGPTRGDG